MKKIAMLALAALSARAVCAEVSYAYDDAGETLFASIGAGETNSLDSAQLGNSVKRLVKVGEGCLVSAGLSAFTGEIHVSNGVFKVSVAGDLGKTDSAADIVVAKGASIYSEIDEYVCFFDTGVSSRGGARKNVRLAGVGHPSCRGCWDNGRKSGEIRCCNIVLEDDAQICAYGQFSRCNITFGGHRLTVLGAHSTAAFGFYGCYFHPGSIDVTNATLTCDGEVRFDAGGGTITCWNNGSWYSRDYRLYGTGSWTTRLEEGGAIMQQSNIGELSANSTNLTAVWEGAVVVNGNVKVNNYAPTSNTVTNPTITLSGPISGQGDVRVGPGWLNLNGDASVYAGSWSIWGLPYGSTVKNGAVMKRGGMKLWPYATYGCGEGETLRVEEADLVLHDQGIFSIPSVTFASGKVNSLVGGFSNDHDGIEGRSAIGEVVQSGGGVGYLAAAANISLVKVLDGTLALKPESEFLPYGRAGLMEFTTFEWNDSTSIGQTYSTRQVEGPVKGFLNGEGFWKKSYRADKDAYIGTALYHGYIWNRTEETNTWDFIANFINGVTVYIDGEPKLLNANMMADGSSATATNHFRHVMSPGPHEIYIGYGKWSGTAGVSRFSSDGQAALMYDPEGNGVVGSFAPYRILRDDGSGELLTIDSVSRDDLVRDAYLPRIDTLDMASGTTFDLAGNALTVTNFIGAGTISNGTLKIAGSFRAKASEIGKSFAYGAEATAVLLDGSVVGVDDIDAFLALPRAKRHTIFAVDGGIGGEVVADRAFADIGWTVERSPDGNALELVRHLRGMVFVLR